MPDEASAARITVTTPDEISAHGERTIAAARELADQVKAGGLDGLDRLDAYDEASALLSNASNVLEVVAMSHPDKAMRDMAETTRQSVAKSATDLSLDRDLYDALAALDPTGFDAATRHYLDRSLLEFRRAGVDRDDTTRARVRDLWDELVGIGQEFERNIAADTRTVRFAPDQLAGLPDDFIRAHRPGEDGQVAITTEYPDFTPFLTYAHDGGAREALWRVYLQRGYPANVDVLNRMLQRRYELATLLGYPSWAEYAAEDKMIGSARNIADFIDRIATAAQTRADRDFAELLARKQMDDPSATALDRWDYLYLEDRVKAERFALDTQAMRPYFEYGRVKAGLMGLAERLFDIQFVARPDVPVWHEDVECFEVRDGDTLLGRIFLDMFPRTDKYNHAACFTLANGKAGVRVPECALICNLPRPGDEPALLLHDDVVTFFHEFGHLLHAVLGGHTRWSGSSGFATEWDFVEAPSQLLEEWVRDAETLAGFAKHHETDEPLPAEMVRKLRAADEFGKGIFVRQQMAYAYLSFNLYDRQPDGLDPEAVEREAVQRFLPYRYVEGTHQPLSFGHLNSYSAIYCTYMWSLVIAKDLFTVFERDGLLDRSAARRYRERVLAPGGSAPAAELIENFLGRPYNFDAYQAWLEAN